jgi:multiple sugar transport system substrate-binding protein
MTWRLSRGRAFAAAAGCSGSGPGKPVPADAKQAIVFAGAGLGPEGQATGAAISAFRKANPKITVQIHVLSANSTTCLSQLGHCFTAGSPTPEVFEGRFFHSGSHAGLQARSELAACLA